MTPWHPLPSSLHSLIAESPDSVLLETARFDEANQTSFLYLNPLRTLTAESLDDLPGLFSALESALAQGHYAAGYLHYECGYHFEPRTGLGHTSTEKPLAWFGIYDEPITFDHSTGLFNRQPPATSSPTVSDQPFASRITLNIDETDYTRQIFRIKDLIAAGDTYQVNFTDSLSLETSLTPAEAFTTLLRQQPVSYAAFLNVAGEHILSLSPELFFRIEDETILTRPMKGTMPRGLDREDDDRTALALQNDEKNRSEHVMIVDLLRNDLGRICTLGSVHVPGLFTIERYDTLHQMTSTVEGRLRPGQSLYEIFDALFPSGSITGAPKIRTMQIIRELEDQPRGIYTGAIGHIAPSRKAVFNVAIRTLTLRDGHARMGVGGGIVADSQPADEYRECLLKTAFLTRVPDDFQLIETILYDTESFSFLDLHLERLAASAAYFNFPIDRDRIVAELRALASPLTQPHRIRLLLHPDGRTTCTSTPFVHAPTGRIRIASQRTHSQDRFLRHKTTRRTLYDEQYRQAVAEGFDEVLFLNERGELTEGAISNLFLSIGGKLLTPPLASGVLPGVYRRHLLETRANAEERVLTLDDLHAADAIYICNSVRGINAVAL
ncbi:aminodeoxychorismate synthase component I [Granulicella sp. WH15]|uniref:aminodeoxychorismate synthase component I n=1 Tax=Granulicella sp. WH15 TaxID=2602070 RepID=UPI001366C84E|nr:aminodeoxychorismate synthase component I [Granulicella sp. WH15]QHN02795.1 aminodeoxychorismate synthase component I [Granulicella sp. WH15]